MTGPALITPDTMAALWGMEPVAVAWPGRTAGLSAVVFAGCRARDLRISAPADPATHLLAVSLRPHHAALALDGRPVHAGAFSRGLVQVVPAGHSAEAALTGTWRVLHLYLPAADLSALAEELGASSCAARGLELRVPPFAADRVLGRMGLSLARRLVRGEPPGRLELDELALTIGKRLLRAHSGLHLPARQRTMPLSAQEESLLQALLIEAGGAGLAAVAYELDRSQPEAALALRQALLTAPPDIRASFVRRRPS